jgi:hypothetical protein
MVLTSATMAMMGNAIATRPRKTKNGSMDAPPHVESMSVQRAKVGRFGATHRLRRHESQQAA